MWQAFWAIARKELIQAYRNKAMLQKIVVLQVIELLMLAWIDLSVRNLPTVIVDHDHTVESRELVARITATHTFDVKYSTTSHEQARSHLRAGRAKVAVIIPPEYARRMAAGDETQILALVDGSDSTSSAQAVASLDGVVGRLEVEKEGGGGDRSAVEITPLPNLLFNPQGKHSSFILPGLLAIILGFAYSMLGAMGIAMERQFGNLERLLMTPMNFNGLILGKLAPYAALGVLNSVIYIGVMRIGFGVPIRGSALLLALCTALYVVTILALGCFFAAKAAHVGQAMDVFYVTTPSLVMSGYIFPLSSVPKWLLPISYALPQTHFIEIMRGICLRGADGIELAPHIAYLVIAPIILTIAAARRFASAVMQ